MAYATSRVCSSCSSSSPSDSWLIPLDSSLDAQAMMILNCRYTTLHSDYKLELVTGKARTSPSRPRCRLFQIQSAGAGLRAFEPT